MKILNFKNFLNESLADKEIHKAVFMIGGAGAGKSYIAKKLFGGKFKFVDSDAFTKFLFNKHNLSLIFNKNNKYDYDKKMKIREEAKNLESKKLSYLIDGLHSIVLDGTGKNAEKLIKQYDILYGLGYDCYMIFINTSLELSQERNNKRERKVAPDVVERMWNELNINIPKYKKVFGNMFFEYNSETDENTDIDKIYQNINNAELKNPAGIALRLLMKKEGSKYLHNLNSIQTEKLKNGMTI